jgi:hypothetical protein
MLAVYWSLWTLAVVAVCLRFYAERMVRIRFRLHDALIVLGLVCFKAVCGLFFEADDYSQVFSTTLGINQSVGMLEDLFFGRALTHAMAATAHSAGLHFIRASPEDLQVLGGVRCPGNGIGGLSLSSRLADYVLVRNHLHLCHRNRKELGSCVLLPHLPKRALQDRHLVRWFCRRRMVCRHIICLGPSNALLSTSFGTRPQEDTASTWQPFSSAVP